MNSTPPSLARSALARRAQSLPRTLLWVVGFLGLGALAWWSFTTLTRPKVTVTDAVEAPVVEAFYSTGTIQPVREYPVKANIAGVLTEVRIDKGDRVKRGDALAVVSEPALRFALEKAQAELAEKVARANPRESPVLLEYDRRLDAMGGMLEIARREQARQTQALEALAGSQADLDRAMDRVKLLTMDAEALRAQRAAKELELRREVDVAQAAVNTAQWNVDQQTLRAPIDGTVLDRPTSQGTRVAVNDTVLRVADVSPANLVMRAAVDEEDVAGISPGQLVRLTLYSFPGAVFDARVEQLYDQADAERRTFEVDVRLAKPDDRLQPGMTGELAFVRGERAKAVVVPSQAIQSGAVWVVRSDGAVERREVEVGLRSVERSEIVRGISPGDRVVLSPATGLVTGRQVRQSFVDPVQAAGLGRRETVAEGTGFKGFN